MKFTKREVRDLIISVVVLSLIFCSFDVSLFATTLFVMFAVFISHEILGHKLVAQHFECEAEYRMWPFGLLLGLVTSFLGFVFVAPGAVYITPNVRKNFAFQVSKLGRREFGLIAFAGPFVNVIIGTALLIVNYIHPWDMFALAAELSFFLAIFNMIPFPPLDGEKIIRWDRRLWLVLFASSLAGYLILIFV